MGGREGRVGNRAVDVDGDNRRERRKEGGRLEEAVGIEGGRKRGREGGREA